MRIGVALVQQETNTFSVQRTGIDAFTIRRGGEAAAYTLRTNSEMAGALTAVESAGHESVPLLYAWALPSGTVSAGAFDRLAEMVSSSLSAAGGLDGVVLALHGSMVAEGAEDADAVLIETARRAAGPVPIAVSLDLHANVTARMVEDADVIVGYHTDPHVDMAVAGRTAARLLIDTLEGSLRPETALAKRPMIVPSESMNTTSGPLGPIRRDADEEPGAVDISLFPVQPWLDVPELGFGVLVTTNGDRALAEELAQRYADRAWALRETFLVPRFMTPERAVAAARSSAVRPFVIAESADAPTAGAAGDSPAMVEAILKSGAGLRAVVPIVDPAAVGRCHEAGPGSRLRLMVGAALDPRWWRPVEVEGTVARTGAGPYRLEGVSFHGLEVSMGRFAVLEHGELSILLMERPALTSDPATFRFAGLDPFDTDILVVRSCNDFRPNFPESAIEAVTLDVPGAATARLENLTFARAGRPLWPLDGFPADR